MLNDGLDLKAECKDEIKLTQKTRELCFGYTSTY